MSRQDLTPFQLADLDRRLCVRLGIASRFYGAQPRLSITGEGMLVLMKALRAQGHSAHLSGYPEAVRAMVNPRGGEHGFSTGEDEPLALALAAAAALGIEVPE